MKHFVVAGMIGLMSFTGSAASSAAVPLFDLFKKAPRTEQDRQSQTPRVQTVQSSEVGRIGQLEEQIRTLNGRIEEMSFQLLQMQEQIRKFQEDNEFRFQDLEGGKSRTPGKSGALDRPATDDQAAEAPATEGERPAGAAAPTGTPNGTGAPPDALGQIIFDANGDPVAANRDTTSAETVPPESEPGINASPDTQQRTASLDNPGDLYQSAYGHVLSGDYSQAENEFRDYLDTFPKGEKAADASFWMGEAQYSQGKFNDAAKTFLNAHQTYAKSPKAPEMLLKLGMSLAALDNKDTACATLREVTKRYPKASAAVRTKVTREQSRLAC